MATEFCPNQRDALSSVSLFRENLDRHCPLHAPNSYPLLDRSLRDILTGLFLPIHGQISGTKCAALIAFLLYLPSLRPLLPSFLPCLGADCTLLITNRLEPDNAM